MNRIVREHYPASRLPEDLREGIDPAREVTVTVSVDEHVENGSSLTLEQLVEQLKAAGYTPLPPEEVERRMRSIRRITEAARGRNTSTDEAVARIRALRDEDD
ncbi:MAG TPA: hypothetical protein VLQ65_15815 [Saliniramus sp.]|nr:hypothetical protein [Saliniramus sp.]